MTTIGQRIRELRMARNLTQRELADLVKINFTYLSRIENDRLDAKQTPREDTLRNLAEALEADLDELVLLAKRVPESMRERIVNRPELFRKIVSLSDDQLEHLLNDLKSD